METVSKWLTIGGGAQDALDDTQLYSSLAVFLSQPIETSLSADESNAPHGLVVLEDTRKSLLALFQSQVKRPLTKAAPAPSASSSRSPSTRSFGSEPPDIDSTDAETLVSNLDAMASAAFRNVVQEV